MRRFVLKFSMFLKVGKEFKVLKMHKCLQKMILFLMWNEVFMCQRCIIGKLEASISIARVLTMKSNLNTICKVVKSSITSKLRDFVRMNLRVFLGPKLMRIPKSFLMECTNV